MKVSIEYPRKEKDRVKVSVEYMDLVDMDTTLARIIYPLIKKYRALYDKKKNICSFPSSMAEGICDSVEMSPEDEAKCLEKWLSILDKVSYSFKALSDHRIDWDGPARKEMYKECAQLKKTYESKKRIKLAQKRDIEERLANPGKPGYRSYEMEERIDICRPIYDKYQPVFDEHKKRVQEGLDLFAQHFGSFWY